MPPDWWDTAYEWAKQAGPYLTILLALLNYWQWRENRASRKRSSQSHAAELKRIREDRATETKYLKEVNNRLLDATLGEGGK